MKLTIAPTPFIVTLNGAPCRQWEGTSDNGTPVVVFVAGLGVADDLPKEQREAFDRALLECVPRVGASALLVLKEPPKSENKN